MNQTTIAIVRRLLCPRFYDGIFKIFTFFLLISALSANRAAAQDGRSAGQLSVGQTIPDYLWDRPFESLMVVNVAGVGDFAPDLLKLRKFKGKLVILDFWATWCGACIANFPKAKRLEAVFKDKLSFILVNDEQPSKARALLTRRLRENGESFHYINTDTLLNRLFFKRLIPHYVWIDANGKVLAATGPDEVNEKNISDVLAGMSSGITNTPDIDRKLPLFSSVNLPIGNVMKYNLLTRGKVLGLGSGFEWRKDSSGQFNVGMVMTNLPLWRIYQRMAIERAKKLKVRHDTERTVYEGKDFHLLRETFFNYEFSVDKALSPKLDSLIWADLNLFSPFTVSFEKRRVECLKMEIINRSRLPIDVSMKTPSTSFDVFEDKSGGLLTVERVRLSSLIYMIKDKAKITLPVMDSKALDMQVSLKVNLANSIPEINVQLKKYGLRLTQGKGELEYMVIRDQVSFKAL